MRGPDERRIIPAPGPVRGTFPVPGSKSVLARLLTCAALAPGTSTIDGLAGHGTDIHVLRRALEALGASCTDAGEGRLQIQGVSCAWSAPDVPLHAGESGTAGRFLTALACRAAGPVRIEAGARLSVRPMEELQRALETLGAEISFAGPAASFPLRIDGRRVRGGRLEVSGERSSQFVSALLLLGPCLPEGIEIDVRGDLVSAPYVGLTTEVMERFGARVLALGSQRWRVAAGGYRAAEAKAPADASSALFLLAAAAVTGGEVRIEGIDPVWAQADLRALDVLATAGCRARKEAGTIVCSGRPERPLDADLNACPDATPALAMVALAAPGRSRLRGIAHLAHKESHRLEALVEGIRAVGGEATSDGASLEIAAGTAQPGLVDPRGDHRIAMAFAILGLTRPGIRVADPGCVEKSWPEFWNLVEEMSGTEP